MTATTGHSVRLPTGRPLARVLAAYFRKQEAEVVAAIRAGHPQPPDLTRWIRPMADQCRPLFAGYVKDGMAYGESRRRRTRRKRLGIGIWPTPDTDDFGVFNQSVIRFIDARVYDFSESTNSTTALRLDLAYDRFRTALASGLEQGDSLKMLTGEVMRIFREPQRAMSIAATEASRAFHGGQVEHAKESGEVRGKQWLASSDACDMCLDLDGKQVGLDENFAVIGTGKYAAIPYPPAHPRCMCAMEELL